MKKYIALFAVIIENFKNLKYAFSTKKYFLLFTVSVTMKMKKYLKMSNQLKY